MQIDNAKVAFFDFCETLTDFQTADAFVDYVRGETNNQRAVRLELIRNIFHRTKLVSILSRIFPKASIHKRLKLYQLKGFSELELNSLAKGYYINRIRPHFIKPVIIRLKKLKDEGYIVGLVSGGYDIYLKYFKDEFGLDFVISSRIDFKEGICTGKMNGLDCLDDNKVILLNKIFPQKPFSSIAFSDSKSDIPMLNYADIGVVISRGRHQKWTDNYKFKEIIWD